MRIALSLLAVGALGSGISSAQQVVSARAGLVHYVEGRVFIGDQLVQQKFGQFPDLRLGELLRTEEGRAEVLLTPGAFLRIAENSSVRMQGRELSSPRFEIVSGSAMVECEDLPAGNSITLVFRDRTIEIEKHGLYRVDADPPQLRVYDGRAVLHTGSDTVAIKGGKQAGLTGLPAAEKFDNKLADTFYAWNGLRSGYIASANLSSARSLHSGGSSWSSNGWLWDPWFGSFTFVPSRGMTYSPFGWEFWSPTYVVYAQPPVYGGGGGMSGGIRPGSGSGSRQGFNGGGNGIAGAGAPPAGARNTGYSGGGFSGGGMPSGGYSGGGGMSAGGVSTGGITSGGGMQSSGGGMHSGGGVSSGASAPAGSRR